MNNYSSFYQEEPLTLNVKQPNVNENRAFARNKVTFFIFLICMYFLYFLCFCVTFASNKLVLLVGFIDGIPLGVILLQKRFVTVYSRL